MSKLVLVLNGNYQPMNVCSWKDAMKKIAKRSDRYKILETYDEPIRGANDLYDRPSVLLVKERIDIPQSIFNPSFTRENLYRRDDFTCQYCGEEKNRANLTLDHVMPQSRDGGTNWKNIVTSCSPCNHTKGDRTPSEAGMDLINKPKKPHWTPVDRMSIDEYPEDWNPYLWK